MDKKIAKIGMIMVLTLALIISSLGVFNFGDNLSKEFKVDATNELTAQAATTPTVWDGTAKPFTAASPTNPGTEANPYLIDTAEKLAYLSQRVNAKDTVYNDKHYKLTADIVLNDTTGWETWTKDNPPTNNWTPIGDYGKEFKGTFDGDNHTVSGIWAFLNSAAGLFGCVGDKAPSSAVVKNVGVIKSHAWSVASGVGAVVGQNFGTIENCYNLGKATVDTGAIVGGVVGYNSGKVINCYNVGSVSMITYSSDYTGGIVGYNYKGTITNCYNTGKVSGSYEVGGIAGGNILGSVTNCYNSGAVSGFMRVGAVVGLNGESGEGGKVANCYSLDNGLPINASDDRNSIVTNCSLFDANNKLVTAGGTAPTAANEALVTFNTGADLKTTLNAGMKAYNTNNPTLTQLQSWVQDGTNLPIFALRVKIDEKPLKVTYDGNNHPFIIKSIPEGLTTGFIVTYQKNGAGGFTAEVPKDFGSYDVNVTRPEDTIYEPFETTITGGVVIEKKALTVTQGATLTKVYDGNTAFTGEFVYGTNYTLDKVGAEDVTLTIDNAKNFNTKHTTATTVTINYTAVLTGVDKDNYSIVAGSFNNPATITAKPLTNIRIEKVYDGNANFSLTLSSANCDGFIANDVASITFATKTFDKGTYTGVGQITTLTRTGADIDNYSFTEANITAAITSKKLPAITAMNPVIYNGGEQPPTVTIPGLTLTTDYTLTWEFKATGETTFAPITGTPVLKNAGTYRVTATGKGNYENSTTDANYEITQKEVVLSWTTPPTGLVYDGNAKIPGVTAGDLIAGEACNVTAGLTSDTMSNITAGQFTFTATALSNPNYKLPANCVSGAYAITKATNAWINTPPLSIQGIKEGGTLNPIAKSLFGAAEFTYYADNNGTIGAGIAVPTAIGTYWVKAHVADDPNYSGILDTGTEVSFKISKKSDGGGGGGGGGFGPSITNQDFFWTGVIIDLKNKDDTVLKRECDYGTMPKNVLETIQDTNKTLDITMMGENLYITSEKIKGLTFDKAEYTIEEIKAMLADKPVITPTPTPTPDPVEPVPEKSANLLWLLILLAIIIISIILEVVRRKREARKNNKTVDDNNIENVDVNNNVENNVDVNANDENVEYNNVDYNVENEENVEYNDEDDDDIK